MYISTFVIPRIYNDIPIFISLLKLVSFISDNNDMFYALIFFYTFNLQVV